jgi:hypothetical protein
MIDNRTAIVTARGTAFDRLASVQHDVLVRAAILTKARGFKYFQVLSVADATTTATMILPGQTYTSGTVTGSATTVGNTTFGNANYSGSSYTTPTNIIPLIKPGTDITIRMYKDGEVYAGQAGVWDAQGIISANSQSE